MSPILRDFLNATKVPSGLENLINFLCPHGVVIGGTYRHFKGCRYIVQGVVRDSADWDGERLVRYVEVGDATHEATRKVSEFLSMAGDEPRFKLCPPQ